MSVCIHQDCPGLRCEGRGLGCVKTTDLIYEKYPVSKKPKVTLVCGGRDFRDKDLLFGTLDSLAISCVVHGGADGADRFAGEWAIARKVPEVIVPAQWDNHGRAAGALRNGWMLRFTKVEHVVAFPGGRGTLNMIQQTEKAGVQLTVISYG